MKRRIAGGVLAAGAAIAGCASIFFCYYTARLLDLAAGGRIDAAHRTTGLRIGAAVFPVAAFCFGWIALACARAARRQLSAAAG